MNTSYKVLVIPEEIWKPIKLPSLKGLYEASNLGRIKSLYNEEIRGGRWGKKRIYRKKSKVLISHKSKNGYMTITLGIDNKTHKLLVHRLVASAFLENPENKEEVNHKNADRADNRVENLEWMTISENRLYTLTSRDKYCAKCRAEL